ncbi:MAG: sugar phosphate isomerase/epimerase family protein [Phycisphaerae bacterium]
MLHLSAFADEIGPDLDEQIRVMRENTITHFELRTVGGKNVLAFTQAEAQEYKKKIDAAGMGVVSIGSPCGKKPVDTPEAELMDMFKTAVERAQQFDAPLIRVFSFYPVGGEGKGDVAQIRDRAIELMSKQAELLAGTNIKMVHENEKGIFGDIGTRCQDLMQSVNSPSVQCAFDFANFVQCGENPADNWPLLKPYTAHIHIKDAVMGSGKVVPAGEGDGHIAEILSDAYASGYRGFLSLEPHLKVAGHSHGETGPELFKTAADALKLVCRKANIPLAGVA